MRCTCDRLAGAYLLWPCFASDFVSTRLISSIRTTQHRESWQEKGRILESKANVISFCRAVQKILTIRNEVAPLIENPLKLERAMTFQTEQSLTASLVKVGKSIAFKSQPA
jgi:hypothetical protein